MKKFLIVVVVLIAVAGIGVYLFQDQIKDVAVDKMTADMFVASDDDAFDPGLPVGAQFPPILASLDGAAVTDVSQYSGPNGLVFVANRSVDW